MQAMTDTLTVANAGLSTMEEVAARSAIDDEEGA